MEDKPKEIIELERALGIGKVDFLTNEDGSVVSLTIWELTLKDISPISELKHLTSLDLAFNNISDLSPLKELQELTSLYIRGNRLSDLSPLKELPGLTSLNLSINQIFDLSPLKGLQRVTSLDLSTNQISDLSPLKGLHNLNTLILNNNQISDISPLQALIKKGYKLSLKENYFYNNTISLYGNPLTLPPIEIVEKGNKAVLEYFRDLEKFGEFEILEGKLLIVGEPKAGKTTLRKKIFDPKYKVPCDEEKETIGVSIQKGWDFPFTLDKSKNFTANIWDFGGQERQYPLHQFFMDDVSCYVLVSDDRADNSNMDKWFDMIKLLSGTHAHVLVILNQINRSTPSSNFNKERYEKQGFKVEVFPIDFCNDAQNIKDLLENIQNRLCNLQHVGQKLPKKICEPIRNQILRLKTEEQKNYLTIEEYNTACINVGLTNIEEQEKALKYLKWIGDVVHFGDDHSLDNVIILNPVWLTQAIYAIITLEELDENHKKGMFNRDWFYEFMTTTTKSKTNSYTKSESKHILTFMLKNNLDICFTSDDDTFLVPLCMPEKLPEYQFDETDGLMVLYQYETIPPGMISRLIVRMSEYIEDNLVSKNATILKTGKARAKIDEYFKENDANQYLKIAVTGSKYDRYELMNEIKSTLKDIKRKSFKNLVFSEEIPCYCAECKSNLKPFFHSMEKIRKRINLFKKTIECDLTGHDVNMSELLGHTSHENFDTLLDIRKILSDLQEDSKLNADFNMAFGQAFIDIDETLMNIDGNTTKKTLSSLDKIFEKGKRVKDWVSILKVPTDSIDVVDKLLNYIEAYKEMVSR